MDKLYSGESTLAVVLVTGILGGGAAWLSGRAIAAAWRPLRQVVVAALLLGALLLPALAGLLAGAAHRRARRGEAGLL